MTCSNSFIRSIEFVTTQGSRAECCQRVDWQQFERVGQDELTGGRRCRTLFAVGGERVDDLLGELFARRGQIAVGQGAIDGAAREERDGGVEVGRAEHGGEVAAGAQRQRVHADASFAAARRVQHGALQHDVGVLGHGSVVHERHAESGVGIDAGQLDVGHVEHAQVPDVFGSRQTFAAAHAQQRLVAVRARQVATQFARQLRAVACHGKRRIQVQLAARLVCHGRECGGVDVVGRHEKQVDASACRHERVGQLAVERTRLGFQRRAQRVLFRCAVQRRIVARLQRAGTGGGQRRRKQQDFAADIFQRLAGRCQRTAQRSTSKFSFFIIK
mmetsp:Transcript_5277/g.8708  ORF Transcript_5277/g.8708 Transcript_5277/m.8708 type:complete len:330 (+) Transcript_5277:579-1568(+)